MKLTEANLESWATGYATTNMKIYELCGEKIRQWHFIVYVPKSKGFYAYSGSDVTKAELFSVYRTNRADIFTDYEECKIALLEYVTRRVESIKRIYFPTT